MKNLKWMPHMRNRYFEGKLLTAEDFEQEQRYMNDKRRLHNRYLHGAGVISGLEVIRIDDYRVSLEMGAAVDASGREILVDAPAILKLSMLDGFEEATRMEGSESLYLCIEYEEQGTEPVHNLTERQVHTAEEPEYNKYREGYHVYVTDDEPPQLESGDGVEKELDYLSGRAERLAGTVGSRGIYLARIFLVKAGDFYVIDKIQNMPGEQYAYCAPYMAGLLKRLCAQVEELKRKKESGGEKPPKAEDGGKSFDQREWQMAEGSVAIPIGRRGELGQCFFSEEIAHGLGLGRVEILLQAAGKGSLYGGAEDIFPCQEAVAAVGYRLKPSEGTFTVGIRLLEDTDQTEITVNWLAVRGRRRNEIREDEKRIYINPSMVHIGTRQDYKLETVCVNMEKPVLSWRVKTPEGGTVDGDGWYHAPNHPGVYEVCAECSEDSSICASVFIVVREGKSDSKTD